MRRVTSVPFGVMNALQQHAFTQLLSSWRRREDARRQGEFRELADARIELDAARSRMHSSFGQLRP